MLLESSLAERFLSELVSKTEKIRFNLESDAEENPCIGPLISTAQRGKVLEYIQIAKKDGCTLLCGGDAPPKTEGYFMVQLTEPLLPVFDDM